MINSLKDFISKREREKLEGFNIKTEDCYEDVANKLYNMLL